MTFKVQDFESNPQLVQIVPPNETVVVIGFELKMGNRAGTMSLCIPYNVIEPIMGTLAAQNWFSYQRKGGQEDHVHRLTKNVNNAPVEIRAFLVQTLIKLDDLLNLQIGDVITTEKMSSRDVLIQVEGKNKFLGQVGKFRGKRSVRITRACHEPRHQRRHHAGQCEQQGQGILSRVRIAADEPCFPVAIDGDLRDRHAQLYESGSKRP
jgi:flagellar motor switch protein FliM